MTCPVYTFKVAYTGQGTFEKLPEKRLCVGLHNYVANMVLPSGKVIFFHCYFFRRIFQPKFNFSLLFSYKSFYKMCPRFYLFSHFPPFLHLIINFLNLIHRAHKVAASMDDSFLIYSFCIYILVTFIYLCSLKAL